MNNSTHISFGGAFDAGRVQRADGAIIFGSSAAGKSTLLREIRYSRIAHKGIIDFPRRLITRRPRMNDDLVENQYVTLDEMEAAIRDNRLRVWWPRDLGETVEWYGFLRGAPGSFHVYSANNAILRCQQAQTVKFLSTSTLIVIHATDRVRTERLRRRNPDLLVSRPEEVTIRLGDSSDALLPTADFVIHNNDEGNQRATAALAELLTDLAFCSVPYHHNHV